GRLYSAGSEQELQGFGPGPWLTEMVCELDQRAPQFSVPDALLQGTEAEEERVVLDSDTDVGGEDSRGWTIWRAHRGNRLSHYGRGLASTFIVRVGSADPDGERIAGDCARARFQCLAFPWRSTKYSGSSPRQGGS